MERKMCLSIVPTHTKEANHPRGKKYLWENRSAENTLIGSLLFLSLCFALISSWNFITFVSKWSSLVFPPNGMSYSHNTLFFNIDLLLQILGVVIVLTSQGWFLYNIRKRYGNLKRAFLEISFSRCTPSDRELEEATDTGLEKYYEKFPLAKFIRDDFYITTLGLLVTLLGLIVSLLK